MPSPPRLQRNSGATTEVTAAAVRCLGGAAAVLRLSLKRSGEDGSSRAVSEAEICQGRSFDPQAGTFVRAEASDSLQSHIGEESCKVCIWEVTMESWAGGYCSFDH